MQTFKDFVEGAWGYSVVAYPDGWHDVTIFSGTVLHILVIPNVASTAYGIGKGDFFKHSPSQETLYVINRNNRYYFMESWSAQKKAANASGGKMLLWAVDFDTIWNSVYFL